MDNNTKSKNISNSGIGMPFLIILFGSIIINIYCLSFLPLIVLVLGFLNNYLIDTRITKTDYPTIFWINFFLTEFCIFLYLFFSYLNLLKALESL